MAILFFIALLVMANGVSLSWMALFGRHSYAIYLAHFALVSAVTSFRSIDTFLMFPLVAGLSLALSYFVVEPTIERRFNRLGHALASGIVRRRAIAGVA